MQFFGRPSQISWNFSEDKMTIIKKSEAEMENFKIDRITTAFIHGYKEPVSYATISYQTNHSWSTWNATAPIC